MKKFSSLIAALFAVGALSSQAPINDECFGATNLGIAPTCQPTVFSNVNATPSDIGNGNNPSCFNTMVAQRDVWFVFTCPNTLFDFRVTLTGVGNSILNPEFAVYRGDCTINNLSELHCVKANVGENSIFLDLVDLTQGAQYFIRVSDYSETASANSGEFTLCVDKIPPIYTIDQGNSILCEGTLYDSGGPDGDYASDKNHTFVICPDAPAACITFTLEYFNIEAASLLNSGESLAFYDGTNTNIAPITVINGSGFADPVGGGGVCFEVQATSGCLTVQFQSDETNEFEGFKGKWVCSNQPCPQQAQMGVNSNISKKDIVNATSTPLTTVTVTNVKCDERSYGIFNFPTDNNALGLGKGLILTSGDAQLSIGPNSSEQIADIIGTDGDKDLDYLSQQQGNGQLSFDACVVELDVYAGTDELVFEYVFGSDEYPEFVGSNFNDIFAFLISGPGIVGDPGLGGAKNIAVLPSSTTPVQINSVNNTLNWQYFRNNEGDQTLSKVMEYDGLTSDYLGVKKSLTARSTVIPCNTYHLKLAIADRGDPDYDSGVFISDIKSGAPDAKGVFASGLDYLTEDCFGVQQDLVVFSIPEPLTDTVSYNVSISGTATLGTDYTLNLPAVITFLPGETQLSFPIVPINDALNEGTETLIIQLFDDFGCGGPVILKTLDVEIKDNVEVEVVGGDTLFVCPGGTLQLQAEGADDYLWSPSGAVSNSTIANPTITPTQNILLVVTGTSGTCTDMDSVFVQIINPQIDVTALGNTNICLGASVTLQAVNNVNNTGLVWTPAASLNDQNIPSPVATPTETTTYTATVTIAGCSASDEVTINVDTLFFPNVINDTTVCQNYPVQLANVLNSTTQYEWTPATGLDDPNSAGPIALPDVSTVYTLTATSSNGNCSQTESVSVNIIPADVDILGDEYQELCLGDTVALTAQSSPSGAQVQWSPAFYLSNTTGPNTVATPDESVTIIATYTINNCVVRDSVRLRVDSLPEQTIRRVEDKAIYCPGDTVYLISKTYEPASFPDIEIEWLPFGGQETPLDLWNLVITATTTHIFERIVNNRGCTDTATVEVPVGVPPTLTSTVTPPQICPGQSAQILVTVDPPSTALEWQDMPPTLSCAECPNPIATPLQTTTYTVTTPDADCPSNAGVTVTVISPPALNVPSNVLICPGGSVQLNNISEPGVTYTWAPPTFLSNPNSATPISTPTGVTSITYTVTAVGPQCTATRTVTVTVASATLDAGQNQTVCFGDAAALTAVTTGTPGTVNWQPGNGNGPNFSPSPTVPTTYTATLTYGANCLLSDTVFVNVVEGVELSNITASPDPTDTICLGTPITLEVTVTPANAAIVWLQNETILTGITGDSVTFISQGAVGDARFKAIATAANGCDDESNTVTYNQKRCVAVPNAFSPGNEDGVNDTFGPLLFGSNTEVTTFQIYNRWGTKVFEASPDKDRWDGTSDGKDAPSDVYAYYIVLRYADGTEEVLKGDIALLR